MDPITMMVASIGMQFFSNYKNNKKSTELQQRQQELQRAAMEHDFERARRLQAESAKLALELENEVHQQRLEDIQRNYDDILHNFATNFAIKNWPLNVLPFVMKGESFGSLFGGTSKSISVHCIFTPSNCTWFNSLFYDDIDMQLESEMNNNWNAQSTHPVVYYGGGWNRREKEMVGGRLKVVPSTINLNDIDLLYTKLKSVPTIVITPYFDAEPDAKLYFRVRLWGMGEDSEKFYRIDVNNGDESNGQFQFTYKYDKNTKPEETEEYINTTITEFVQYLECLVGFVADKYFWSMYGNSPCLPLITTSNKCSTYLLDKYSLLYNNELLLSHNKTTLNRNMLLLFDGIKSLYSKEERQKMLDKTAESCLNICIGERLNRADYKIFDDLYVSFLEQISLRYEDDGRKNYIDGLKNKLLETCPLFEFVFCANVKELHRSIASFMSKANCCSVVFKVLQKDLIAIAPKKQEQLVKGVIMFCSTYFPMFPNSGVYELLSNNKAIEYPIDPCAGIEIDINKILMNFQEQRKSLEVCIDLYDRLSVETDIDGFVNSDCLCASVDDIYKWIKENRNEFHTGIDLFKGFSRSNNKYLVFGVFKIGTELQLLHNVLILFYDIIPDEINGLFGMKNKYCITFINC